MKVLSAVQRRPMTETLKVFKGFSEMLGHRRRWGAEHRPSYALVGADTPSTAVLSSLYSVTIVMHCNASCYCCVLHRYQAALFPFFLAIIYPQLLTSFSLDLGFKTGAQNVNDAHAIRDCKHERSSVEKIGVTGPCQKPQRVQQRQKEESVEMRSDGDEGMSEICGSWSELI